MILLKKYKLNEFIIKKYFLKVRRINSALAYG